VQDDIESLEKNGILDLVKCPKDKIISNSNYLLKEMKVFVLVS
jgi:hypothetical protein